MEYMQRVFHTLLFIVLRHYVQLKSGGGGSAGKVFKIRRQHYKASEVYKMVQKSLQKYIRHYQVY